MTGYRHKVNWDCPIKSSGMGAWKVFRIIEDTEFKYAVGPVAATKPRVAVNEYGVDNLGNKRIYNVRGTRHAAKEAAKEAKRTPPDYVKEIARLENQIGRLNSQICLMHQEIEDIKEGNNRWMQQVYSQMTALKEMIEEVMTRPSHPHIVRVTEGVQ